MPIQSRAYNGEVDLRQIQAFMSEMIVAAGQCGLLHPGDVPHWIYNLLRRDEPAQLIRLWDDGRGNLRAWSLIYPRLKAFDFFLRPEVWQSPLVTEVLETTEAKLREVIAEKNFAGKLNTDGWD